jgi:hypothetical protein
MLPALNMQDALSKMAEQVTDRWHKQQIQNEPGGWDEVVIHLHPPRTFRNCTDVGKMLLICKQLMEKQKQSVSHLSNIYKARGTAAAEDLQKFYDVEKSAALTVDNHQVILF